MKRLTILLIIISQVLTPLFAADGGDYGRELMAAGDSAYIAEDYPQAVACYEQALRSVGSSSQLYYNLGNAFYRDGKLGNAVIAYERALKIDPSNSDARFNLDFVKTRLVDRQSPNPDTLGVLLDTVTGWMSPNAWATVTLVLFVIAVGLAALYIFTTPVTLRKIGFFGGFVSLLLSIMCVVIAFRAADISTRHNEGVIVSSSVIISSAPRLPKDRVEEVALVHEGTKLSILDSLTNRVDSLETRWYKVELDHTHQGWIQSQNIEII
ncbi:MAG: tetratricopeptide repeat protein [Clostridium sp.]|nr:tetratricopeptide repeat protein [Clostridium sp.]